MKEMDAKPADGIVLVVSAVNIRKGGTLTILRDCLEYLSGLLPAENKEEVSAHPNRLSRVIALVHDKSLCGYPGIEYIEIPWTTKGWLRRLWCEYVTMYGISKRLASELGRPVDLWLSMHDTTPRVIAAKQEVYCQTSFPFLKRRLRDLWMDPKVFLFSVFTKFAYKVNVHRNSSIIVQQEWFRDAMAEMLHLPKEMFRVIPPASRPLPEVKAGRESARAVAENASVMVADSMAMPQPEPHRESRSGPLLNSQPDQQSDQQSGQQVELQSGLQPEPHCESQSGLQPEPQTVFFYASTADCHKNFELLFEAARLLEAEVGAGRFKVSVTISGNENRYARWLHRHWGNVSSIDWAGFLSKEELFRRYETADCFVFPSRIETWGLPVTEYMSVSEGPVLIADLPYAHETVASGCGVVAGLEVDYGEKTVASGRGAVAGLEVDHGEKTVASGCGASAEQKLNAESKTDASRREVAVGGEADETRHVTTFENRYVRYFSTDDAAELAKEMREVIDKSVK